MLSLLEFSNYCDHAVKHQHLTTIADATFSNAPNGSCKAFRFKLMASGVEPRVNGFSGEPRTRLRATAAPLVPDHN